MFTRRDLIEEPNFFKIDFILSPAFQHGTRHDVYENPATGCRAFIEEALPMLKMINLQTALPNLKCSIFAGYARERERERELAGRTPRNARLCTLHSGPCTLHPAHWTLHSALYTGDFRLCSTQQYSKYMYLSFVKKTFSTNKLLNSNQNTLCTLH